MCQPGLLRPQVHILAKVLEQAHNALAMGFLTTCIETSIGKYYALPFCVSQYSYSQVCIFCPNRNNIQFLVERLLPKKSNTK